MAKITFITATGESRVVDATLDRLTVTTPEFQA
jgi:hypothetical protein